MSKLPRYTFFVAFLLSVSTCGFGLVTYLNNKAEYENIDINLQDSSQPVWWKSAYPLGDLSDLQIDFSLANEDANSYDDYKKYIENLSYLDALEAAINEAGTTRDQFDALEMTFELWDAELNKIYALLLSSNSDVACLDLDEEQRLWVIGKEWASQKYADEYEGASTSLVFYYTMQLETTKQRTLELIHRYFLGLSDLHEAMEAYQKVLQNQELLYEKRGYYLSEETGFNKFVDSWFYSGFNREFEDQSKIRMLFTIIDPDEDGIPEVVIAEPLTGSLLVLHYSHGTVYGYPFTYRGMSRIKADGSFEWSNSAFNAGYSKLKFSMGSCEYEDLAYSDYEYDEIDGEFYGYYYVDGLEVDRDAFYDYILEHEAKENVKWYDLTDDSFASLLK